MFHVTSALKCITADAYVRALISGLFSVKQCNVTMQLKLNKWLPGNQKKDVLKNQPKGKTDNIHRFHTYFQLHVLHVAHF